MTNLSRVLVFILLALTLSACPNFDNSETAQGYTPNDEQGSGPAEPEPESNRSDADEEQGPGDQ